MNIVFSKKPKNTDLAIFMLSPKSLKKAVKRSIAPLKKIIEQEKFTGKEDSALFLPAGFEKFKRLLIVGVGEKASAETIRRATGTAIKVAQQKKIQKVSFFVFREFAVATVEASVLANYSFQKYKTVKDEQKQFVKEVEIVGGLTKEEIDSCRQAQLVCNNANLCRDLINDNSSTVNPDYFESFVKKHCKKSSLRVSVLKESQLKKLGMKLVLAVGRGSESRPRVIVIEYNGNRSSKEKFLFVGKGITFDTGGLDIKPGRAMETMRDDMSGAAVTFALLKSCAELKLKKNVVGILGLAENLVDALSYRQGDVYTSMKGLTVENNSTDAEGRLVLADTIYYGVTKFKPKLVVDFSTLTGSAMRTFGDHVGFMCSTSDSAAKTFFEAGMHTFERVWRMPMYDEYRKEVKGTRSDIRSLNKRPNNGAIFAACFLDHFTEKTPFVHLDIAGTAFIEEPKPYLESGGTGFGVRLAIEFLKKK